MKFTLITTFMSALAIGFSPLTATPQSLGTAFTYQGNLSSNSAPANGSYDLEFLLFNAATNGTQLGVTVTNLAVGVTNGLFTTTLDFGTGIFTGNASWLAIGVRSNGSGGTFTPLTPLQPLTPTPNAIFSTTASNLSGTLPSTDLSGTYGGVVALTNSNDSFAGNGNGLTSLSASNLTGAGTLPVGVLPTNVALLNSNETFHAQVIITNSVAAAGTFVAMNGNSNGYAIYGSNSAPLGAGKGSGLFGISGQTNGAGVFGANSNSTGTGLIAVGNGATPAPLYTGGSGLAATGSNCAVYAVAVTPGSGTGLIAAGNGNLSVKGPVGGAGVMGEGNAVGVYGLGATAGNGTTTGSTGVVGVGNDIGTADTLTGGSGVAGTGLTCGVYAASTTTSTGVYSMGIITYNETAGSSVYVNYWDNAADLEYKIAGDGSVSTLVNDSSNQTRVMFAPEAPEILFEDYGSGQLTNGSAQIALDPIFSANIRVDAAHPLRVFVQVEGDCNGVYVSDKSDAGFTVVELAHGTSGAPFSWHAVGNRADEASKRTTKDANGVETPARISRFSTQRFPVSTNLVTAWRALKTKS